MIIASFVIGPDALPHPRKSGRGSPHQRFPETPSRLAALLGSVREAYRRSRSREYLARLDAHMLKDVGLSRAEAEYEINKPFWRC